jgi:hypothetical protein
MAKREQEKRRAEEAKRQAVIAGLPPAVHAALEAKDREAFEAALSQLPPEKAERVSKQLKEALATT